MPHTTLLVGRRLPGVGAVGALGSFNSFGGWTDWLWSASAVAAPVTTAAARVASTAYTAYTGGSTSLVGEYVASGGYKYRYSSDGSITILASPRGGAGRVIVPGAAGYDAIKAEIVKLAAAGGRGVIGSTPAQSVMPSAPVYGLDVPGANMSVPVGVNGAAGSGTDTSSSIPTVAKIAAVGGGVAVIAGLIAWAATGGRK